MSALTKEQKEWVDAYEMEEGKMRIEAKIATNLTVVKGDGGWSSAASIEVNGDGVCFWLYEGVELGVCMTREQAEAVCMLIELGRSGDVKTQ